MKTKTGNDLICISHLRWDFVYQRPQHLMTRAARTRRVFYVEEPVIQSSQSNDVKNNCEPYLEISRDPSGVLVVVPYFPEGLDEMQTHAQFANVLEQLMNDYDISDYTLWCYTPMPLPALSALAQRVKAPHSVVYDCMDELANFRFAPLALRERESQLFAWADVVFTGGFSLYEAKCKQHHTVYPFPSSVDIKHFSKAKQALPEPHDLTIIPHPRIGFIGVIDERMDLELLDQVAKAKPDYHFVMIGPVVKISYDALPQGHNLHYLGQKQYQDLPAYLAHIDTAMMPFAINDSTRFISPTKTPEYLAAGKPVISTPIRDVVRPYGEKDLVIIANDATEFVAGLEHLLNDDQTVRRNRADAFVGRLSWDQTWDDMDQKLTKAISSKYPVSIQNVQQDYNPYSRQFAKTIPAATSGMVARPIATLSASLPVTPAKRALASQSATEQVR
jgi:glycosyltransferase involved in cell wall biosynthesis